jgi:hypothetical protein
MRRHLNLVIACLVCAAILGVSVLAGGGGGVAVTNAAGDVGVKDQAFPANPNKSDFSPTGEKPQSKLWFNGGRWWADMLHSDSKHYIFYLSGETWVKTNTQLDDRLPTQADVLWDGTHLYVASGAGGDPSGIDLDAKLFRYSYTPGNPPESAYALDTGFPVTIRGGGAETIVLEKDSLGKLWITYTQGSKVYVNHSGANPAASDPDLSWNPAAAYVIPAAGVNTSVKTDDISSLIAYDGKIGVFWSNQNDTTFYFAYHVDGAPTPSGRAAWPGKIKISPTTISTSNRCTPQAAAMCSRSSKRRSRQTAPASRASSCCTASQTAPGIRRRSSGMRPPEAPALCCWSTA